MRKSSNIMIGIFAIIREFDQKHATNYLGTQEENGIKQVADNE